MKHVMLDIETMGNSSEAAIMSIGACYFNPATGEIGEIFHQQINLQSSVDFGLTMDVSTILWWMKQSDEARSKFYDNHKQAHITTVLTAFSAFVKPNSQVWGNGATFDNTIMKNAFEKCGLGCPWKFWNDRDVRTMVELGLSVGIDPKRDLPFEGVKHDALADAIHQAKYTSMIWQRVTK
jgi:hypothetical protein